MSVRAGASPAGSVGFGVIGSGSMVAQRAVLPALDVSDRAHLVAHCSLSASSSDRWADRALPGYDDVIHHPDVEVVYIPTGSIASMVWRVTPTCRASSAWRWHSGCDIPGFARALHLDARTCVTWCPG